MTDQELAVFLTFYAGFWMAFIAIFYLLYAIPLAGVFKKAGESRWKAFVPFVNSYTRTKIVFGEERAWWFLIDFILGGLFACYRAYNEARAFGYEPLFSVLHILFQPITTFVIWLGGNKYEGKQRFILDK